MSKICTPRLITGVIIKPDDGELGVEALRCSALAMQCFSWPCDPTDIDIARSVVLMEGNIQRKKHRDREGSAAWIRVSGLSNLVRHVERGKASPKMTSHSCAIGIGSRKFCLLFAHFWATKSKGRASNWGFHLMEAIAEAEDGEMVWYNHRTNKVYRGEHIMTALKFLDSRIENA